MFMKMQCETKILLAMFSTFLWLQTQFSATCGVYTTVDVYLLTTRKRIKRHSNILQSEQRQSFHSQHLERSTGCCNCNLRRVYHWEVGKCSCVFLPFHFLTRFTDNNFIQNLFTLFLLEIWNVAHKMILVEKPSRFFVIFEKGRKPVKNELERDLP